VQCRGGEERLSTVRYHDLKNVLGEHQGFLCEVKITNLKGSGEAFEPGQDLDCNVRFHVLHLYIVIVIHIGEIGKPLIEGCGDPIGQRLHHLLLPFLVTSPSSF
jgi:hypothetical protein